MNLSDWANYVDTLVDNSMNGADNEFKTKQKVEAFVEGLDNHLRKPLRRRYFAKLDAALAAAEIESGRKPVGPRSSSCGMCL